MSVQKREVEFSKETDDCFLLLINVVKAAKAGKSVTDIAASELQDFVNAVAGAQDILAEAAFRKVLLQTVGYRAGELADAFLPVQAQQL